MHQIKEIIEKDQQQEQQLQKQQAIEEEQRKQRQYIRDKSKEPSAIDSLIKSTQDNWF